MELSPQESYCPRAAKRTRLQVSQQVRLAAQSRAAPGLEVSTKNGQEWVVTRNQATRAHRATGAHQRAHVHGTCMCPRSARPPAQGIEPRGQLTQATAGPQAQATRPPGQPAQATRACQRIHVHGACTYGHVHQAHTYGQLPHPMHLHGACTYGQPGYGQPGTYGQPG